MTWEELASKIITQMTPEERQKEVQFTEPYDNHVIHRCDVYQAVERLEAFGNWIEEGEWYLG